jgi:hypothetical protein
MSQVRVTVQGWPPEWVHSGPFTVRWNPDPPMRQGAYSRTGQERLFEKRMDAVVFVMESVPQEVRGTAWIDAASGPGISIQEIEALYQQDREGDRQL